MGGFELPNYGAINGESGNGSDDGNGDDDHDHDHDQPKVFLLNSLRYPCRSSLL